MFLKLQITAPNCFMYRELFLDCSPALPTFSSSHSAIILTKTNFLYTETSFYYTFACLLEYRTLGFLVEAVSPNNKYNLLIKQKHRVN